MNATQTGSEPQENVVEPNVENKTAGENNVPQTPPAGEPSKTDDEVVQDLIGGGGKKLSRKEKAIIKSHKSYAKALSDDGGIDIDILKEEYEKNPKGLKSFAEKEGFDYNELLSYLSEKDEPEVLSRVERLEQEFESLKKSQKEVAIKEHFLDKVAEVGMSPKEFSEKYGERFKLFRNGLIYEGLDPLQATSKAFEFLDLPSKRDSVTGVKIPPKGKEANAGKVALLTREEYYSLSRPERDAYYKDHNKNGLPVFKE